MRTGINEGNQCVVLGKSLHKSLQHSKWTAVVQEYICHNRKKQNDAPLYLGQAVIEDFTAKKNSKTNSEENSE